MRSTAAGKSAAESEHIGMGAYRHGFCLNRRAEGVPLQRESIACGFAQQIFDVAEQPHIEAPLTATLPTQDAEGLAFADPDLLGAWHATGGSRAAEDLAKRELSRL